MKSINLLLLLSLFVVTLNSCDDDDDDSNNNNLDLNITGLENLGSDFVYEGWIIVDAMPVSTGIFTVDDDGKLSKNSFEIDTDQLALATKFVLTIEPETDPDPAPADTKILAGDFSSNSASLTIAPIGDFSNISGQYILATPTDGMNNNENSGIWFLNFPETGPPPTVGLNLPTLPAGWKYEGWVVIDGIPVTTGTFTAADATDDSAPYSGPMPLGMVNDPGGFFPGEDFLENAPMGLTFPTDLAGTKAVISIEPSPDNSAAPFTLKPLVHDIATDAKDKITYDMNTNLNFPTGTVNRN